MVVPHGRFITNSRTVCNNKYLKHRVKLQQLEKLQDTFKLKWEKRGWSEDELRLIAEREFAFQALEMRHA